MFLAALGACTLNASFMEFTNVHMLRLYYQWSIDDKSKKIDLIKRLLWMKYARRNLSVLTNAIAIIEKLTK